MRGSDISNYLLNYVDQENRHHAVLGHFLEEIHPQDFQHYDLVVEVAVQDVLVGWSLFGVVLHQVELLVFTNGVWVETFRYRS